MRMPRQIAGVAIDVEFTIERDADLLPANQ
jgi:hypothetical protein